MKKIIFKLNFWFLYQINICLHSVNVYIDYLNKYLLKFCIFFNVKYLKILVGTDLKITFLYYQNNYVENSNMMLQKVSSNSFIHPI